MGHFRQSQVFSELSTCVCCTPYSWTKGLTFVNTLCHKIKLMLSTVLICGDLGIAFHTCTLKATSIAF